MIIYYNARLDIFGLLQSDGLLQIEDASGIKMVLTETWEAVSYL